MRRITITVDEGLAETVKADVRAGRSPSMSAWIGDAIQSRAQARTELAADLEELASREPSTPETVAAIARALRKPESWVVGALRSSRGRRGRARRS